ncbi:MAG: DNA/RNA nuclease SfsA [Dehalococcoidia bacterium]|nr:DNA/RNA nuclease SfsA [Dehalococcoidia bacterium]
MKISGPLMQGAFLQRLNRFVALVEVDGKEELAHVANSGRLRELFQPRIPVYLRRAAREGRKTAYDLALVDLDGRLVSVDSRLPNDLVQEALLEGSIAGMEGYTDIRREVPYGAHRIDLLVQNGEPCLIETKSITLVAEGRALFPDAPTERGASHMAALLRFRRESGKAAVMFVVQRDDAVSFSPNDQADPGFGRALREAAAGGVMVRAFACRVGLQEISLSREIPICLPPAPLPP